MWGVEQGEFGVKGKGVGVEERGGVILENANCFVKWAFG